MKSSDSIRLGVVGAVAVVGIIIMTLLSTYNINGYYGFAARGKGNIGLTPGLSFEAESGQNQGFLIGEDPKASENHYVYSPDGAGSVSYSFNVERPGLYKLTTKVSTTTPYAQHNSFYVQLNDYERVLVDAQESDNNYKWNPVATLTKDTWLLQPGTHTIKVDAVESNVKIDSVALSLVASQCADNDKDGYGKPASEFCQYNVVDCDDRNPNINPSATESCENNKDDNCNGRVNEGCAGECVDNDNDGYGENCNNGDDCDDNNPNVHSTRTCSFNGNSCGTYNMCVASCPVPPAEVCGNQIDENCNGVAEECSQPGLSRSFPENIITGNSTITITITKTLTAGQSTLLTEEYVPSGFTILNAGTGTATGNTIRWAELTGATSGTYTYTVRTPVTAGTYAFSGLYTINGGNAQTIGGSTQLTVNAPIGNIAPTIYISAPPNGSSYPIGTNVTVTAIASDFDGTISNVEFGQGFYTGNTGGYGVLAPRDTNAPYERTFTLSNVGTYLFTAQAFDNLNSSSNVAAVYVFSTNVSVNTFPVNTLVQAESGTNNGFTIQNGAVFTSVDESNSISYAFNVPVAGQYIIRTGIVNADPGTDSFYVGADGFNAAGNDVYTYDTIDGSGTINGTVRLRGPNGNYSWWQFDPMVYTLGVGVHTFTFYGRESNTKLDYLMLSTYSAPACSNGQTQSCTTGLLGVCSAGTQTCSNNNWGTCVQNVQPSTEICGNGVDEDCNGADLTCSNNALTRSFSNNPVNGNSIVTVTITKTLTAGQTTLLTEETVPSGFTITNAGTGTATGNTIRWAELTGATSGTYTYTVQAPSNAGNYTFSGLYTINGGTAYPIAGYNTVIVQGVVACQNGQTQSCTTGLLGVCSAGTQTCSNNNWGTCVQNVQPSTEICGNGIDENCNGVAESCNNTSGLSRSFSANPATGNSQVTVTITKTLQPGQSTLLTEETVPSGFTITNAGTGTATGNTIRWAELTGAVSGTYTYTVTVPGIGGNYNFVGSYTINGGTAQSIGGTTTLIVSDVFVCSSGDTQSCSTGQSGACSVGTQTCSNNAWSVCVAPTPTTEVCNNDIDEDCNGVLNNECTGFCDTDDDGHNQEFLLWCAIYGPVDDCDDNNGNIFPGALEICGNGVDEDCSGSDLSCPNTPPIVSISSPVTGSTFNSGSNITVVALASDPNGSIAKVEFYRNNALVRTDNSFPYSYPWNNAATGNYTIYARAYDNLNATTNSASITIYVAQSEYCGNGVCAATESCTTCSADCGVCPVGSLVRTFSGNPVNSNTNITVTITKTLQPTDTTLLTEEYVPSGFTILNAGTGTATGNTIRWAELTGASSGTYTYTVRTPVTAGTYAFSGLYTINGGNTLTIEGATQLTVQGVVVCTNGQTQSCTTGLLGVCSAGTQTCSNNNWGTCVQNVQPSTEICGNGIDEDCNGADLACAGGGNLSRSFSSDPANGNSNVTVTITKTLLPGQSTLLTEEYVPSGFTILNAGTGTATGNIIRWAELTGATSGTYTYTVRTPVAVGSYNFSGLYSINGGSTVSIAGDTQLVVQSVAVCTNGQTQSCTTGLLGVCSVGTQTCSNTVWGSCVQNVQPSTEICGNGIDEDCNGADLTCSNTAPSVFAGIDQSVMLPNTASLSGAVSDDGLPNPPAATTVRWTRTSGPGTVTFGNANVAVTTATFSTAGTYVLRLTANDSVLTAYDQLTVTVSQNLPPTVSITSPVSGTNFVYPSYISINVTASDVNGSISRVEFYADSILRGTDTTVPYYYTWTNATLGNHTLTARAYDNFNASTTSSPVTIGVVEPFVCSTGQTQSCTTGLLGVCSAGTRTCSNNAWGSCVQNVQPSTEICGNGIDEDCNGADLTCPIALTRGFSSNPATGNSTLTVTITKTLQPGQSTLLTEEYVPTGFTITSAGTGTATGNTIRWAELTGATSGTYTYTVRTPITAGLYNFSGLYSINGGTTVNIGGVTQLTIQGVFVCSTGQTQSCTTGLQGVCAAGTRTCTNNAWGSCVQNVQPSTEICGNGIDENCNGADLQCNTAPVVNAGTDKTVTLPGVAVLSGTVSDDGLPNPPATTTVRWTRTSGPASVTFTNQNSLNTNVTFSTNGTYVLRLTANDSILTSFDALNVVVSSQPVNVPPTVSIVSPLSGTNFLYPSYISINVTASDSDGSISRVEFYTSGILRSNDTTLPYYFTWMNATIGNHTLTARAYDNQNAMTTSSPVIVGMIQPICTNGQTQSCSTGLLGICGAGTATCSNNNWGTCVQNVQPSTEICGNGIDEDCNGVAETCVTNGLFRSFSSNPAARNTVITVTITKNLLAGQSTVLVEEYVPAGYTIVSPGTGSATGNTIRWAELIGAVSGTYNYTVRTPNAAGLGTFSGMYSINGGVESVIGGSTQLTVQ